MISRPLYAALWDELARDKAMVFLAGPRQAGKTTLANDIALHFANRVYLNWDVLTDRVRLARDPYFFESVERRDDSRPLVVFDEIHRYRQWKNYLKGVYDRFHAQYRFLVAGSGRLDLYRKGEDSLAGRYELMRLWPFTLAELADRRVSWDDFRADPSAVALDENGAAETAWRGLASFSGFSEPFVRAQARSYRRWSAAYRTRLVREDLRELTGIKSLDDVETLFALLPERVGSLLSIQGLAEDLPVSYNTVVSWLETLERFYLLFSITPWSRKVLRATRKARKTYLFDYAGIRDAAAPFENMVAVELFRAVQTWTDMGFGDFHLHFVRNKEGQEVDFLVCDEHGPVFLVEAKAPDTNVAPALRRFQDQLGVPAVQLTNEGTGFRRFSNGDRSILVAPAWLWLVRLP